MSEESRRYNLTRAERETVILFDEEERIAHIYTTSPIMQRKYDRLCEEDPDTWKCIEVDSLGYFKKYEAPADRIAYRKAPSEAKRAQAARMYKSSSERE